VVALALICGLVLADCTRRQHYEIGDLVVQHPAPLAWHELEPGFQSAQLLFTRKSNGTRVMAAVFRIDPARYRFQLLWSPELLSEPAGALQDMVAKTSPLLAVNANFYLPETYKPIGLMVSDGKTLAPWKSGAGSGVFFVDRQQASIEWAKEQAAVWDGAEAAVQAGPLIIEPDGKPGIFADTQKYRARTALGLDRQRRVVVLCTRRKDEQGTELSGLDLFELMQIMQLDPKIGGLGLKVALNLDGGTSTALALRHPKQKLDIHSVHPVPTGLAVFKR
jgi:exopolysaccharide biosynthesis protein